MVGEDSNHEIILNEPEPESDTPKSIEQPTRPKQNRGPKQIFTYNNLGKPPCHIPYNFSYISIISFSQ